MATKDRRRHNRGTPGNAGGRKAWSPLPTTQQTKEQAWADARALVRHMAAIGFPQEVIGRFLRPVIRDDETLRKHFAWELENGMLQADIQVAGVAFRMAVSGRHELSTWRWLERRVPGFRPKQDLNVNAPIPFSLVPGDV